MANQGKHRKNPVMEWLAEDESTVPTKSRGSHVVDSYINKGKAILRKFRAPATGAASQKADTLSLRDPAPTKPDPKPSQAASWEHQKRVERLSQLRAPYQYKGR